MITANAITSSTGHIMLEFIIPGKAPQYGVARDVQEAQRMVYFRNRNFIVENLLSWLKQREHAISPYPEQPEYNKKLGEIIALSSTLEYFSKSSFHQVCRFVAREEKNFFLVAPHNLTSKQYKHYSTSILPIIRFCKTI